MPNTEGTTASKPPLEPPLASDDKQSEALARLEARFEDLCDRHKEERFLWIAVTVILMNILLLGDVQPSMLPIAIVLLELPLLFLLAKKLGIESVAQLFDRIISDIGRTAKNGD
ncbi:hypothetical protein L2D00_07545 [Hyphomonadaceae bacterium BL14]|nr:hypothetical protein L2D00_07545 [Hyphomonadaceae bacterium BL14]